MTENTETKKEIKILAIESSCDETAAAVVVNGRDLRSNVISSQIALHTLYGGVVPEIASRKHIEKINPHIDQALSDAQMTLDDIDAIGVTYGPGLVGALISFDHLDIRRHTAGHAFRSAPNMLKPKRTKLHQASDPL